jgi:hypothetical protein
MDSVIMILGYPSRFAKFWLLLDQLPWRIETVSNCICPTIAMIIPFIKQSLAFKLLGI